MDIFFDGTMQDRKLRRAFIVELHAMREERRRVFRKGRKDRIAVKRAFFGEA
jgi:hypothetical protein